MTETLPFEPKNKKWKKGDSASEKQVEERKIYIAVAKDFSGESLNIVPKIENVKVYEVEHDIRLV